MTIQVENKQSSTEAFAIPELAPDAEAYPASTESSQFEYTPDNSIEVPVLEPDESHRPVGATALEAASVESPAAKPAIEEIWKARNEHVLHRRDIM